MNVTDAAHLTVHGYPGGSEALATRMGMSAAVLRNKVNPNNPRNMLTLEEADRLIGLTNDRRILQALASAHGCGLRLIEDGEEDFGIDVLSLDATTAMGELASAIKHALKDGVITEREKRDIEAAGMTSQRTVMMLVRKLCAMASVRPHSEG